MYFITYTRAGCVHCTEHSQHIVEMGQMLKNRLRERTIISPVQLNTTKPVGVHFRQQGHDYTNLRMIPLEQIRSRDSMVCKINKLDTVKHGLNKKSC